MSRIREFLGAYRDGLIIGCDFLGNFLPDDFYSIGIETVYLRNLRRRHYIGLEAGTSTGLLLNFSLVVPAGFLAFNAIKNYFLK